MKRTSVLCEELDAIERCLSGILELAELLFLLALGLIGRHEGQKPRNNALAPKLLRLLLPEQERQLYCP